MERHEKYRIGKAIFMFVLLIIALAVAAHSYKDWEHNINSEYGYLEDTFISLSRAENAYLLEDKKENISEAIQIYEGSSDYEKPHLDEMKALIFLNEIKAIDSFLPSLRDGINDEINEAILGPFWHSLIVAIAELIIIAMCFIGIFIDYDEDYIKVLVGVFIFVGILLGISMI